MKRLLAVVLGVLMGVLLFAGNVCAADIPDTAKAVYTFSDASGCPGDTIEVTVSLETFEAFKAAGVAFITYDEDVLEYNDAVINEEFKSLMFLTDFNKTDKTLVAASTSEVESYNGDILTLYFTIKDDAAYGEYEITCEAPSVSNESTMEAFAVAGTIVVEEPVYEIEGISLDVASANLNLGDTLTINAIITPENATDKTVTWKSSDASVATVEDGVVTAINKGTAKITATASNGMTADCTVTVDVFADKVEFTPVKITSVAIGKTISFKAKALREDGLKPSSASVVFEIVEGEEHATIDAKGKLTAISYGDVVVRARAAAGTEDAYADVTIKVCVPATKVTLNKTKASMALGYGDLQLEATLLPEENTDTLKWTVDKPEIATVDENGLVTAHAVGKVKVTALAGSGKSASCTVTIGEPATKVEVTALKTTSVAVGKSITLKGKAIRDDKIKPVSTAVVYEFVEELCDGFALLDSKGKLIALEEGTVVVRISAEAGTDDAYEDVEIRICNVATKVTLNKTKASMALGYGDLQLEATLVAKEGECDDTLKWTVDKPEIATVDEDGVVTAHATGKAKVTALAGSGKSASCTVTIGEPATGVDISSIKVTSVAVGKSVTLKGKAVRDDKVKPVSTAVVFEIIEGEEYATVDAKGKLVGIAEGDVVVRISAEAGTYDAYEDVEMRVCKNLATKVTLNMTKATVSLSDGDLQLEATLVVKAGECDDTLKWTVDKPEIATVDEDGLVTVHSAGKVKVTATAGSGKSASCTITVTD